jgi:hypothetical protein
MTENNLTKYIKTHGGFVMSEGSLRMEDLLSAAYNVMNVFKFGSLLCSEIECVFDGDVPTPSNVFYGTSKIHSEESELNQELWDSVYVLFEEICPDGFYFGSQDGDGACIGFWKEN